MGRQFDPKCAATFLAMREQIVRAMLDLMPGTEVDEPFIQPVNPVEATFADEYVPDPRN